MRPLVLKIISITLIILFALQGTAYADTDMQCRSASTLQVQSRFRPLDDTGLYINILEDTLICLLRSEIKDPETYKLRFTKIPFEDNPLRIILDFRSWRKGLEGKNWIIPCYIRGVKTKLRAVEVVIKPDLSFDIRARSGLSYVTIKSNSNPAAMGSSIKTSQPAISPSQGPNTASAPERAVRSAHLSRQVPDRDIEQMSHKQISRWLTALETEISEKYSINPEIITRAKNKIKEIRAEISKIEDPKMRKDLLTDAAKVEGALLWKIRSVKIKTLLNSVESSMRNCLIAVSGWPMNGDFGLLYRRSIEEMKMMIESLTIIKELRSMLSDMRRLDPSIAKLKKEQLDSAINQKIEEALREKEKTEKNKADKGDGFISQGYRARARFESGKEHLLKTGSERISDAWRERALLLLADLPKKIRYVLSEDEIARIESLRADLKNYRFILFPDTIVEDEDDFLLGMADSKNKTIFLAEDIVASLRPNLVDEYLLHELICPAFGHKRAIYYQQLFFFDENYPDRDELSIQTDENPYKGDLGAALRDIINRKLSIMRSEEDPVATGLKKVSFSGERRCDAFLNDTDFSRILSSKKNMKAISDALTKNYQVERNRRSITVKLPDPVEIGGRLWTSIYLKGIAFDQNMQPEPHRGDGYVSRSFSVSRKGEFMREKASPSPQSAMELTRAKIEFDNHYVLYHLSQLRSQNIFVSAPIGFGVFPDAERYHGRKLGFVMLGVDSEMPKVRADGMIGTAHPREKYFADLGRAYRVLHEAGFSVFFLHIGNISVSGKKIYIHDLDHAEFFGRAGADEKRRLISQAGNLLYYYLKYCRGMYDKYDPWKQFASAYFYDKDNNFRLAVADELEETSTLIRHDRGSDLSPYMDSAYFEEHMPLLIKTIKAISSRSEENAVNDLFPPNLNDPAEVARSLAEGAFSLSLSRKIALVFDNKMGGLQHERVISVLKGLDMMKKEHRLNNLEVCVLPPNKIRSRIMNLRADGYEVFMFAREDQRGELNKLEDMVRSVYIDENNFPLHIEGYYYPLAEIVAMILTQNLYLLTDEEIAKALKDDLKIDMTIDGNAYIFKLPRSTKFEKDLIKKYANLKELLLNA